jgi:cytochrome c peroxidase
MKRQLILAIFVGVLSVVVISCKDVVNTNQLNTTPYDLVLPADFPDMYIHPDNPLTVEGVELGRKLYYDSRLNTVGDKSCSGCHEQESAFTTEQSNALAHINLGWAKSFLWNGAVEGTMEDIMLFEVEDFFKADVDSFNLDDDYKKWFKEAFGVDQITTKELSYALAQYERTKISANSKYDDFLAGLVSLTPEERRGWIFFNTEKGDCFHCHGGRQLTDNLFHNNGLDSIPEEGRMTVTGNALNKGEFKTPTLRNIELTAPYMHDARFQTLEEVVRFYSEGLKWSPTIDPLMKQVDSGGVGFTESEILDMVAFLKTFTDTTFTNNPALSNPF